MEFIVIYFIYVVISYLLIMDAPDERKSFNSLRVLGIMILLTPIGALLYILCKNSQK